MKFPTDAELREAIARSENSETGSSDRARRHLQARDRFREAVEGLPLESAWDYWRSESSRKKGYLSGTGYERALAGAPGPLAVGASLGLDVLDPILYQALVADQVARLAPGEIIVREVRYSNPFEEVVAGVGAAEQAVKTTASVIDALATVGSRGKLKKLEVEIAEAALDELDDQIEERRLAGHRAGAVARHVDLKQEKLRKAQLESDILKEDLLTKRIRNAQAREALNPKRQQQALVELFIAIGELDLADAIAAADPSDVAALGEFEVRPVQLEENHESDTGEEE